MSGKIEWFAGDLNGLDIYNCMETLAHTWDDLVDGDKSVSQAQINEAFRIALVRLPANPLYAHLQKQLLPLWEMVIDAYEIANSFENEKDLKGLEIAHTLRYAAGHIVGCVVRKIGGLDHAREVMPEIWKQIVAENFNDYVKEHLDADQV